MPVRFSFANLPNDLDPESLLRFMMENSTGQRWYRRAPPPPGVIRAAALDLLTVANVGGAAASMAALFWMAYDKFIAPRRRRGENSGIFIVIGGTRGTQVWLGGDVSAREEFIDVFVSGVMREASSDDDAEHSHWQVEIQLDRWVEMEREDA